MFVYRGIKKSRPADLFFIRIRPISPRIISQVGRDDWAHCLSEDSLCLAIDFLPSLSLLMLLLMIRRDPFDES